MKTERMTRLALLTAFASVIFIVELQLPDLIAIPGIKAGLANIITVYALYKYTWQDAIFITLSRIIIGAIFSGNFSAILYSLSGAFFSLIVMICFMRIIPAKYVWLCSAVGGILHNVGQIAAAVAITGTSAIMSYLPFLILSGCIAGTFTGLCAGFAVNRKISKK